MPLRLTREDRLMEAIKVRCQEIRVANGYQRDVREVERLRRGPFAPGLFPSIGIYTTRETPFPREGSPLEELDLRVVTEVWIAESKPKTLDDEVRAIKADVYVAMLRDEHFTVDGTPLAVRTNYAGCLYFIGDKANIGGVALEWAIHYRYYRGDPYGTVE